MSEVNQQASPLSDQERTIWVREQFQKAQKYLAEKGVITKSVSPETSRYLAPVIAVWKLNTNDNQKVWVISGDVPCDHIVSTAADTVRESLRNFSMKWQMQAEGILQTTNDPTQIKFAQYLVSRAEGLYQLFENDQLWNEKGE